MNGPWLSADEQRAWRAYLSLHRELTARLHRGLQADAQLSLADYEVLVHLSEMPDGRIRPYELAEDLQWEQSRLSHHLSRMQRRDLVKREECPTDGRGAWIVLTPCGRKTIEGAAPAHAVMVRELFFDAMSPGQVSALEQLSTQTLAKLAPASGSCQRAKQREASAKD